MHCSCLAAPPAAAPASSAVTCSGVLQGKDPPWHRAEGQPAVPGWTRSAETKQRGFASLRFSPRDTPRSHVWQQPVSLRPQLHLSPAAFTPCGIDNASAIAPASPSALRSHRAAPPLPPESHRAPIPPSSPHKQRALLLFLIKFRQTREQYRRGRTMGTGRAASLAPSLLSSPADPSPGQPWGRRWLHRARAGLSPGSGGCSQSRGVRSPATVYRSR